MPNSSDIPNKFITDCPENSMVKNFFSKKHLAYFAFKGKVYPLDSPIRLTQSGRFYCKSNKVLEGPIVISEHYFIDASREEFRLDYYKNGKKIWLCNIPADRILVLIERVNAEPADIDYQEYADFITNLKTNYYDNSLTPEEDREFVRKLRIGIPPKVALPERLKDKTLEELNLKPKYNDFNCPSVIFGWILFIIYVFATGIFKDWYIQLILNAFGALVFMGWRQNKLWMGPRK